MSISSANNGILLQNDSKASTAGMKVGDQSLAAAKRRMKTNTEDRVSRLERYEELDKNHPLNRPFTGSSSFRGPAFKRKYTNLICVIIFMIFNAAFLFYGILAWRDGASGRLTKGMDFRAEICGVDKLKNLKFLYYASPAIDLNVKFCVEKCPTTSGQKICLYDVDPKVATPFCYTQSATTAIGLFCLPNEPINRKIVDTDMSNVSNLIKRIAGDIGTAMDIIAAGLVVSFVMAAVFLRVMFDPKKIKFIIWGSIWATVIALIMLAGFFYKEYLDTIKNRCIQEIDKRDCGGYRATIFKVASLVCLGIDMLYLLLIMKIFNRINLGVGVLQATTKCSSVFAQIKILPFALTFFIIFVAAFFLIGTVLGFSAGDINVISAKNIDGGYVKTIVYSDLMRYLIAFNFFMLQWWFNVVLLVSDTILSYALSIWYFEKRKETLILPGSAVIKNVLKYHLGTLIMLGLYKIIFRPFRLIMALITLVMRKPQQHLNIVRFMQACCLCCIHVHERILRYQSKHAVVQTAMWSESYRVASKRAWFLIFRNSNRFRNLDSLCTFILFLTKIVCALVGSLFVYSYIILVPVSPFQNNTSEIETPLAPTLLVFYVGFFFASIFQSALDIATKTLLQCYLMDEEMFVGEQRFASKDVLAFIEFHRIDDGNHNKFGKLQQYVKGMKGTLNANVPLINDEDPDEEENRKLEKKVKKGSEESSSGEEEEEEQAKPEPVKKEGSDDESEEESEEESSEEDEDNQPALFKGNVFGQVNQPNHQTFSVEFGKMNTVRSLEASQVQVNSSTNKNLSQFGKTAFSIEKVDESRDSGHNKSRNSPFMASKKGFAPDISQSDDGDTQLMKHKSDVKDKSSVLFGEWNDLHNDLERKASKDQAWKPLETSVLSSGSVRSSQSKRPLVKRQDTSSNESRIQLADASMLSQKIVEKSNVNNNNTMRSDKHNLFNKSKLAHSTMRLEYDDDEEDTSKYRL